MRCRSDPSETRIKSIAYQHGFWHLDQFAQDYRRLFGERPSETLEASKKSGTSSRIQAELATSLRTHLD